MTYWFSRSPGAQAFEKCEEKRCTLVENLNESDVVTMSGSYMATFVHDFKLPYRKSPNQRWVFFAIESPQHFHVQEKYLNRSLFNVTFTYKSTSHVHYPYGFMVNRTAPYKHDVHKNWSKKKDVAWLVSHCDTPSKREVYVGELKKYINVTTYGNCGVPCPKDGDKSGWGACTNHLRDNYKFYLAFENSFCKEYITEKLWRTLNIGILPIVFGGADYKAMLPQNSYIDVQDFKSPQLLAEYLKVLSANVTLYEKYFQWKKQYDISCSYYPIATCNLCKHLHLTKNAEPYSVDMKTFWNIDKDCMKRDEYLTKVGISTE